MHPIDVTVEGEGRPLVLLHGFTQGPRSWDRMVDALGGSLRILRVTLPGHGPAGGASAGARLTFEAAAGAVADAVAAAAGPEPATWFGYSLGGRLALRVALDRPDLTAALALLGATAGLDEPGARAARVEMDGRLAAGLERKGLDPFLDGWLAQPLFEHLPRSVAGLEERREGTADGLASALRLLGTGAMEPLWDRLDAIRGPVLLLAGEHDTRFAALAVRLATGIGAAAAVALVPGAGHAAHLERPGAVAALLARFLSGVPGPA